VPLAINKVTGKTKIVATKVLGSAQGGAAPFHRIAEIHFPSISALQACAATEGAKDTLANAVSISTGGPADLPRRRRRDVRIPNGETLNQDLFPQVWPGHAR